MFYDSKSVHSLTCVLPYLMREKGEISIYIVMPYSLISLLKQEISLELVLSPNN